MRGALAIAVSFAVAAVAVPVVAEAAPRRGKVVRVERPKHAVKNRIRLCVQYNATSGHMLCLGAPPPAPGEELHLLDFNGPHLGTGRVLRSAPSSQTNCKSDQVSDVFYSSSVGRANSVLIGMMGVAMDDKTTVKIDSRGPMPTRARDGESRWLGFDIDGEGDIDLLLTMRKCDLDRPPGHTGQGQCLAYWVRDSDVDDWRLHNEDAIYDCN